jgi:hypothetical protein
MSPRPASFEIQAEFQIMLSARVTKWFVGMAALVLIAALFQAAVRPAAAKDGGLVGIEGTLTAIDPTAGTLTVRLRKGTSVVVATTPATKIERNERRATLAAFLLGDRIEAKFASAATNVALRVEAVGR